MPGSKLLLVDGYNVINRVPQLKASLDGGLQNARNQLALRAASWSREHPAVECVIVFDGDFNYGGGRDQRLAGIRCIFSWTSHGGDDELIRLVRDHKGNTSDITVVSDDNKVRNNCRAYGAIVRPSGYIMMRKSRPARTPGGVAPDGKGLGRKAVAEIDQELKKKFGI